jgi:hypothetical protein
MHRRGSLFGGIVLVLLAGLLLLRQLNIITGDIFGYFWPLVIILFGIWLIFGFFNRRSLGPVVGGQFSIPLEGTASAYIKIDHGGGRVNLRAGTAAGELMNGTFGGGLEFKSKVADGRLEVKMRTSHHAWGWWPGESLDWDFALSRDVPLSLNIDSGASTSTFDLSELKVTELDLDTGASTTEITLPANAGSTHVDIDTGASTLKIVVPAGVAARIQTKTGLATVSVDANRFPRLGSGLYQSADYATAANRADITIDAGLGTIEVK